MSCERLTVFAGLNRFKPHVWQKQVFAGRNPTLVTPRTHFAGEGNHPLPTQGAPAPDCWDPDNCVPYTSYGADLCPSTKTNELLTPPMVVSIKNDPRPSHGRCETNSEWNSIKHNLFNARCTLVQSAVLRSHVVCLSVCLSVCNVGEL